MGIHDKLHQGLDGVTTFLASVCSAGEMSVGGLQFPHISIESLRRCSVVKGGMGSNSHLVSRSEDGGFLPGQFFAEQPTGNSALHIHAIMEKSDGK